MEEEVPLLVEELEVEAVEDEDSVVEVDDELPLTVELGVLEEMLGVLEEILVVLLPFDAFDSSPVVFDASPDAAVINRADSGQLDSVTLSHAPDHK